MTWRDAGTVRLGACLEVLGSGLGRPNVPRRRLKNTDRGRTGLRRRHRRSGSHHYIPTQVLRRGRHRPRGMDTGPADAFNRSGLNLSYLAPDFQPRYASSGGFNCTGFWLSVYFSYSTTATTTDKSRTGLCRRSHRSGSHHYIPKGKFSGADAHRPRGMDTGPGDAFNGHRHRRGLNLSYLAPDFQPRFARSAVFNCTGFWLSVYFSYSTTTTTKNSSSTVRAPPKGWQTSTKRRRRRGHQTQQS